MSEIDETEIDDMTEAEVDRILEEGGAAAAYDDDDDDADFDLDDDEDGADADDTELTPQNIAKAIIVENRKTPITEADALKNKAIRSVSKLLARQQTRSRRRGDRDFMPQAPPGVSQAAYKKAITNTARFMKKRGMRDEDQSDEEGGMFL